MKNLNRAYIAGAILLVSGVAWSGEAPPPETVRRIEQRVHRELSRLPYYSVFDYLEYRVEGTTVVLSGYVARQSLKNDAGRAVAEVAGVSEVVNEIEVLPVSFLDDRIRLAAYRAIYLEGPLSRYGLHPAPPIRIIVRDGGILLEGVVPSEIERNLAHMAAMSVPGVFEVINRLRVAAGAGR